MLLEELHAVWDSRVYKKKEYNQDEDVYRGSAANTPNLAEGN